MTIYNKVIDFTDVGAAYVFDGATRTQTYAYQNPQPGNGDRFGQTLVAAGMNLLVGAPGDKPFASRNSQGSVQLFDGPELGDLRPIKTLTNLQTLDVSSQQIGYQQIGVPLNPEPGLIPLTGLSLLTTVNVSDNRLTDLIPLASLLLVVSPLTSGNP